MTEQTPDAFGHLLPDLRRAVLNMTKAERIELAKQKDLWIGYDKAEDAIKKLGTILAQPRSDRMDNLLVVARSDNGKSTVLAQFKKLNTPQKTEAGKFTTPVVLMEMPATPLETRFWTSLLNAIKIPHRESDSADVKKPLAMSNLTYLECRMLIVDEIHNLLVGSANEQKRFLVVLKNLSNQLKLPIVAAGTKDALRAIKTDLQLSSRFKPCSLPKWQLNFGYRRLLASFEQRLPLALPSGLSSSTQLGVKIFDMSDSTIGSIARILREAAIAAIEDGTERIELRHLGKLNSGSLETYSGEDL
jgi:hypothetical protein